MKKIVIAIVVSCILLVVALVVLGIRVLKPFLENNINIGKNDQVQTVETSNLPQIASVEDLSGLVDKIYDGLEFPLQSVQTQTIDLSDSDFVNMITGLENGNDFEYLVASEPMMSSQAYSLVLAKVKDGVNANEIAKKMQENINTRKWICVSAEKVYATNSGNVVCLVMSSEELAKPVYEKFKSLAGQVGQEYEKTEEEPELPADMY